MIWSSAHLRLHKKKSKIRYTRLFVRYSPVINLILIRVLEKRTTFLSFRNKVAEQVFFVKYLSSLSQFYSYFIDRYPGSQHV